MLKTLANLGCFQATWLIIVLGPADGRLWLGAFALAASWTFQSYSRLGIRLPSLGLIAGAAAFGAVADSVLALLGLLAFPASASTVWPAPPWMALLWANFATTLDESLAWGGEHRLIAAGTGAVGGPLAYMAGESAGALALGPETGAYLAISVLFGIAFPCLAAFAKTRRDRLVPDGHSEGRKA